MMGLRTPHLCGQSDISLSINTIFLAFMYFCEVRMLIIHDTWYNLDYSNDHSQWHNVAQTAAHHWTVSCYAICPTDFFLSMTNELSPDD